ncbi:nickel pincer cofactor biosynthesis protein LarB [Rhizobium sp. BK251]|uniref:nickel pincer cofactor biosynthesis protein LarB n=1 Tax=Rhizobium sp. BK251 TaxID=2512125 RepID=UPI0010443668|nr:nickel pincer cofactor biosynthesis protein LarB [Rhizobium sp. BK251]TCL71203.1 hypothetical protein EV286_106176 [Rhizobium sp. BK251]
MTRERIAGEVVFDVERGARIGIDEAVFCAGKSAAQIAHILDGAQERDEGLLLTRLDAKTYEALPERHREAIDYCEVSRTGFYGPVRAVSVRGAVAIVAAGTSDAPVAREAERTLRHAGVEANFICDVGVAGIWRLTDRLEEIRRHPVVIAVAGMDAALASVLGGLVQSSMICVPTSVGYGAAEGGRTALNAMLASCAPGLVVCNIDNGYGAASAALRMIGSFAAMAADAKRRP